MVRKLNTAALQQGLENLSIPRCKLSLNTMFDGWPSLYIFFSWLRSVGGTALVGRVQYICCIIIFAKTGIGRGSSGASSEGIFNFYRISKWGHFGGRAECVNMIITTSHGHRKTWLCERAAGIILDKVCRKVLQSQRFEAAPANHWPIYTSLVVEHASTRETLQVSCCFWVPTLLKLCPIKIPMCQVGQGGLFGTIREASCLERVSQMTTCMKHHIIVLEVFFPQQGPCYLTSMLLTLQLFDDIFYDLLKGSKVVKPTEVPFWTTNLEPRTVAPAKCMFFLNWSKSRTSRWASLESPLKFSFTWNYVWVFNVHINHLRHKRHGRCCCRIGRWHFRRIRMVKSISQPSAFSIICLIPGATIPLWHAPCFDPPSAGTVSLATSTLGTPEGCSPTDFPSNGPCLASFNPPWLEDVVANLRQWHVRLLHLSHQVTWGSIRVLKQLLFRGPCEVFFGVVQLLQAKLHPQFPVPSLKTHLHQTANLILGDELLWYFLPQTVSKPIRSQLWPTLELQALCQDLGARNMDGQFATGVLSTHLLACKKALDHETDPWWPCNRPNYGFACCNL